MKDKEIELQNYQPSPPPPPGQWDQFTRQAAIVILLISILTLIALLLPIISLFAVTGIFILVMSYPVNKLRAKTKFSNTISVLIVFIPVAILMFFVFSYMVSWFVDNTHSLINTLEGLFQTNKDIIALMHKLTENPSQLQSLLGKATEFLGIQLGLMAQFISYTSIAFFLSFLFILEMPANLQNSIKSLSGESQREFGILADRLSNVWNGWLRSTVITAVFIGATSGLELFLFGIPYAAPLGIIIGFLNLIPTFGALISYILIILVTYTQGSSYLTLNATTLTLLVLGVNIIINYIGRYGVFPKLAGKSVHLPVFLIILGLVVAAVLWGVIGVILVIPLLGTVREFLSYILRKINRQDPYPGESPQSGYWAKEIATK